MTDNGQGHARASDPDPAPVPPFTGWQGASRVEQLATWLTANRSGFTEAALERSAIAGGYSVDEVRAASALVTAHEHELDTIKPIKSKAKWVILAAYGVVWLLFAIPYVVSGTNFSGPTLQAILTVALLLGLGISALFLRVLHPDPSDAGRALTVLLVVPVVVLLAITGLCLPFVTP